MLRPRPMSNPLIEVSWSYWCSQKIEWWRGSHLLSGQISCFSVGAVPQAAPVWRWNCRSLWLPESDWPTTIYYHPGWGTWVILCYLQRWPTTAGRPLLDHPCDLTRVKWSVGQGSARSAPSSGREPPWPAQTCGSCPWSWVAADSASWQQDVLTDRCRSRLWRGTQTNAAARGPPHLLSRPRIRGARSKWPSCSQFCSYVR